MHAVPKVCGFKWNFRLFVYLLLFVCCCLWVEFSSLVVLYCIQYFLCGFMWDFRSLLFICLFVCVCLFVVVFGVEFSLSCGIILHTVFLIKTIWFHVGF